MNPPGDPGRFRLSCAPSSPPPHAVVTVVAHTTELHAKYMRHGFTLARGRQLLHRPESRPGHVVRVQQREGPPRPPTPPAYSLPVSPAATPTSPTPLRLEQPQHSCAEIEHRRHQCHRHDQRLRDLPTHLLPPSGRASLRASPDDPDDLLLEVADPFGAVVRGCGTHTGETRPLGGGMPLRTIGREASGWRGGKDHPCVSSPTVTRSSDTGPALAAATRARSPAPTAAGPPCCCSCSWPPSCRGYCPCSGELPDWQAQHHVGGGPGVPAGRLHCVRDPGGDGLLPSARPPPTPRFRVRRGPRPRAFPWRRECGPPSHLAAGAESHNL